MKLGKSLQRKCVNFFSLKLTFEARKVRILESIFLQNKNWLRVQDLVDTTFRVVRISLLITAMQRVLRFSSGNLFYKSNRKLFSCVCIARGVGRILDSYANPIRSRGFFITVENSPNVSSVYIRLWKHRKKVFYCFYKINFPIKNAKLFVWHWLKEKFLPVAKSCTRSLARVISSFCKKVLFKIWIFLA